MEINITQKDISSELCQRCAACCDVSLTVPNVDPVTACSSGSGD